MRWLVKRKVFFIELTPLAPTVQTPIATKQLFSALHSLRATQTKTSRLLRHDIVLAAEVFGSQQSGIRYIVQADSRIADDLQHIFSSFLPDVQATILHADCTLSNRTDIKTFKLRRHFMFPLITQTSLKHHDMVARISNLITKLHVNEVITFQLVLKPTELRQSRALLNKLMKNKYTPTTDNNSGWPFYSWIRNTIADLLMRLIDIVSDVYFGQYRSAAHYTFRSQRMPARTTHTKRGALFQNLSPHQEKIANAIDTKITQPLFQVAVRFGVSANTRKESKSLIGAVESVLTTYTTAPYQGLRAVHRVPFMDKYRRYLFSQRLPSLLVHNTCTFSASEIANLYHFPSEI